mgnify:CR=1 FL=1
MKSTTQQIRQRQNAVLEEISRIRVMRRGTLSEQHYAQRRERKGGAGACGPYFILQGYGGGKRFSKRIASEQVEQVRNEIAQGRRFQDLCKEYMTLGEALAEDARRQPAADEAVKKGLKSRSSRALKSSE